MIKLHLTLIAVNLKYTILWKPNKNFEIFISKFLLNWHGRM